MSKPERKRPFKRRKSIYPTEEAKKARRKEVDVIRNSARISIGSEFERWMAVKNQHGFSHTEVASLLLDSYLMMQRSSISVLPGIVPLSVSGLTHGQPGSGNLASSGLSGIHSIPSTSQGNGPRDSVFSSFPEDSGPLAQSYVVKEEEPQEDESKEDEESDQDKDEMDQESEEDESEEDEESDHDEDEMDLVTAGEGELVFDIPCEEGDDAELEGQDDVPFSEMEDLQKRLSVGHAPIVTDAEAVLNDMRCIAFASCLENLINTRVSDMCPVKGCGSKVDPRFTQSGTAMFIDWTCIRGHTVHRWASQPRIAGHSNAGDVLLSSNIVLSGNNFREIALLMRFMNIGMVGERTFDHIQTMICFPAINDLWEKSLEGTHQRLETQAPLVLAGDWRNDSPGLSAQYCTYTLMDYETKDIVFMLTLDKSTTGLKSAVMAREALRKALNILTNEKQVEVAELVTDAHVSIAAMIRKDFPHILHQWDLWHASKHLGKKIQAAAKEKDNGALLQWKKKVTNHFWYCAEKAESELQLKSLWCAILYNTVDKHEWPELRGCGYGNGEKEEREAPWLEADSKPYQTLRKIVMEKTFLTNLKYFVNFRHTGFLEAFHNHLLMYAAKRFAFEWPAYSARTRLAALDYQAHKDRQQKLGKNGQPQYRRYYNKNSNRWSVTKVMEAKTYPYIHALQLDIVQRHMANTSSWAKQLDEDDPRHIAPIARVPSQVTSD